LVLTRRSSVLSCSYCHHDESVNLFFCCSNTVEKASILPVAKVHPPSSASDYRPVSITPVLSRVLERIVFHEYIYPSLQQPQSGLSFTDQFAFQPTGSTTCALIHIFHTISTLFESNPYVIVIALDFSKAFDTVRHSAVLDKFSSLHNPDFIYNWIESFFRGHSHCTKFGFESSVFHDINASIIQGSSIGPASYVVTASDLFPVTQSNSMTKFTDDTYLVVPATNQPSCASEIQNVERWASINNLSLNRVKYAKIVFVAPRCRQELAISPPSCGFDRIEHIKALGVTITRKLSVTPHIDELLSACAKTLFALRTLRQHGLPSACIQDIFQATVVAEMSYASQAWWGYANVADRSRLECFLQSCVRLGYRSATSPTLASVCDEIARCKWPTNT
jgi:Reverse transcriptase (RNA-dependent DNA polymerase)